MLELLWTPRASHGGREKELSLSLGHAMFLAETSDRFRAQSAFASQCLLRLYLISLDYGIRENYP